VLVVENITKRFPGVVALDNVCLQIEAGKITAIIGENGAGKSTLMKILSGVYHDFDGRIIFKNQQIKFSNPKEAQEKGIAIIHQELNLIPYLTVAENVFLGREIVNKWGMLDKKAMRLKTNALLEKLKLNVDPNTLVSELKVGQQQVIEIAKALLVESDVIIMDEPTSAIGEAEVEVLFEIINDLKKEGKAVVYISHKLDELFKIADKYIVLRDGKMIEAGEIKGISHNAIIQKMVGREIAMMRKNGVCGAKDELLRVENLCMKHPEKLREDLLGNISFNVNRGEIVGIFGLMGAGRTELLECIFGMYPKPTSGEIIVEGKRLKSKTPAAAIKSGLALVPEDRKKDGLILGLNVRTNISLSILSEIEEAGILNNKKETVLVKKYIHDLQIKTPSEKQLAKNLSGGNQQKVVLAKWLATNPKILMLDEPTRGIDINAKNEIYKLILKLADEGLGILVVSSELPEILAISDRILVMAEGNLTAEFSIREATEDKILNAAIPKTK
jgi:ribose transport system ATP-binding protein